MMKMNIVIEEKSWQTKYVLKAVDDNLEQVKVFSADVHIIPALARVAVHQHQDHELE